jgi:hypothetical protein
MKFKLTSGNGSVREFTINDVNYHPGDIVDLPQTYEGEKWLVRIDPVPVVTPPPQKIIPVSEPAIVETKPLAHTAEKPAEPNWGASKKKTTAAATA